MRANSLLLEQAELARKFFLMKDMSLALSALNDTNTNIEHIQKELKNEHGNIEYLNSYSEKPCDSILGIFSCSYHPYLSLEYSLIDEVVPTVEIQDRFKNIRIFIGTFLYMVGRNVL